MNFKTKNILDNHRSDIQLFKNIDFQSLPKNLILKIFLELKEEKDLLSCALLCKKCYCIARSDPIWNRFFYLRFFPTQSIPSTSIYELNGSANHIFKLLRLKENLKINDFKENISNNSHVYQENVNAPFVYTKHDKEEAHTFDFWDIKTGKCIRHFELNKGVTWPIIHGIFGKYFYLLEFPMETPYKINHEKYCLTGLNIETGRYFDIAKKGFFPRSYWPAAQGQLYPYALFHKDYLLSRSRDYKAIHLWDLEKKCQLHAIEFKEKMDQWGIGDDYLFALMGKTIEIREMNTGQFIHRIDLTTLGIDTPSDYYFSLEQGYFIAKNSNNIIFFNIKSKKTISFKAAPNTVFVIEKNLKILHSLCILPYIKNGDIEPSIAIADIDRGTYLLNATISNEIKSMQAHWYNDSLFLLMMNKNENVLRIYNS